MFTPPDSELPVESSTQSHVGESNIENAWDSIKEGSQTDEMMKQ